MTVLQDGAFQCILAGDGLLSFVMFYYADGLFEQFESEFDNEGSGFGGFMNFSNATVQAGINSGNGLFESIEDKTNISSTSNVDIPGVWMYQTNERSIIQPSK